MTVNIAEQCSTYISSIAIYSMQKLTGIEWKVYISLSNQFSGMTFCIGLKNN